MSNIKIHRQLVAFSIIATILFGGLGLFGGLAYFVDIPKDNHIKELIFFCIVGVGFFMFFVVSLVSCVRYRKQNKNYLPIYSSTNNGDYGDY